MSAVRVIIHGRVQGVGYRSWTVSTAKKLQLKGWVRNLSDGTVEALFCGESPTITAMVESCKRGPAAARVDRIESFTAAAPEEEMFLALPTV